MAKKYAVNKLDPKTLATFTSLFANKNLKQLCIDNNSYIDRQIEKKFFEDYKIDSKIRKDFVLIRINGEDENTFFVRPILKKDFALILEKASYLHNLLSEIIKT